MANPIINKKSKLNTHKAVRESMLLNHGSKAVVDLTKSLTTDSHLFFQLEEIKLANHLHTQAVHKKAKLTVKWWEN